MKIALKEQDLLKLFREGKEDHAFNLIVDIYKERLYWHIRRILIDHDDTDDVLQNVFIKVWKGLPGFRESSRLYTWLYRIATNEALTFLKNKKRRNILSLEKVEHELAESLLSDQYFNGDELQHKLQEAILSLPEKQRLVFNMKYFDEMTYEDISEITGTTTGALKASYHHAVKKIEKFMETY